MSQHNQVSEAYPPPVMAYPPAGVAYPQHQTDAYVTAPPPVGYPTVQVSECPQNSSHISTKTRGEGFWKGCVAAICCCWVVEFCCGC